MAKTVSKANAKRKVFELDYDGMKKVALSLRAINHKDRQKILELLDQTGELPVTEIYKKMRMEQSKASAYLALMRKANLVKVRAEGQQRFYSVHYEQIQSIGNSCKSIVNYTG